MLQDRNEDGWCRFFLRAGTKRGVVTKTVLLADQELLLELPDAPDWVVVNAGGHGFYRVRYSDELMEPAVYVFPLPSEEAFAVAAASGPPDGVQGLPGEVMYQDAELEVWLNVEAGRVILHVYGADVEGLGDLEAIDDATLDTHPVVTMARTPTAVAYALGSPQELRGKRLRLALRLHERAIDLPCVDFPGEGTP